MSRWSYSPIWWKPTLSGGSRLPLIAERCLVISQGSTSSKILILACEEDLSHLNQITTAIFARLQTVKLKDSQRLTRGVSLDTGHYSTNVLEARGQSGKVRIVSQSQRPKQALASRLLDVSPSLHQGRVQVQCNRSHQHHQKLLSRACNRILLRI